MKRRRVDVALKSILDTVQCSALQCSAMWCIVVQCERSAVGGVRWGEITYTVTGSHSNDAASSVWIQNNSPSHTSSTEGIGRTNDG
jgi:hypothetical protein